jgi:cobalt-zinc-cadmium efflux system outer membrane protein
MPFRSQVRTWIVGFGLVFLPSLTLAQDRPEREVVELIVRDGPQARALRAETDVRRREQSARLAYSNPSVTYSREGAGFAEFVQAEQTLQLFGTRAALARAGVAVVAAAEAERDGQLWLLRADAASAVARLVAEQARLESARAHAGEVERLVAILRTREEAGEGARFDRLRGEQELHETNQILTGVRVAVAESRAKVSGMLPPDVVLGGIAGASASSQSIAPPEDLFTRASSARAELRALREWGARATFEADAARRTRLPSPTLFGGLKRGDDGAGRATGGVFGISVALPLFDAGRRDAARWEAERTRVNAERAAIEYRIRSEVAGAAEVFTVRQNALAREQPGSADELAQIAEVAYREGEIGILELLDAVRTSARARNRGIDLRLDVRLAQIALERAVGETLWP